MRPGERDADDGYSQHDRYDQMAERQPPTGENQLQNISKNPKGSSANIVISIIFGARYCFLAER